MRYVGSADEVRRFAPLPRTVYLVLVVCIPGAKSPHNPHRSAIMPQSTCSDAMTLGAFGELVLGL